MTDPSGARRGPSATSTTEIEAALRWLATRRHARPLALLQHAVDEPGSESAVRLEPLVAPTASLGEGTPAVRALAVWGLIIHAVNRIGSNEESRRRNALHAAFRLERRPEIAEPWKSTLEGRFSQLLALPGVFGDPPPTTTTPMHRAWRDGVAQKLAPMIRDHLVRLAGDPGSWEPYLALARSREAGVGDNTPASGVRPEDPAAGYRSPTEGAQPVFVVLFITTVFMRHKTAFRRITERLVTAQEDGVDGYLARALTGFGWSADDPSNIPVRPLWNCRLEDPVRSRTGESLVTKLRFPRPLLRNESHFFVSEAIDDHITEERRWVNVEIDHHGIAPGRLLHGHIPVSGLTIRIRFDDAELPDACWWYAEQSERQRLTPPPRDDPRRLQIIDGNVEHTFTERCHPRDNYGVAFSWPDF
ncbi:MULTISPECIES: hypothetical protein [Amycolatopsis]|uniref:Uncharacterized protein n=1 Tax=Amycolatopsis bullii TaxID=941987 RepID=A0ABQ3K1I6_9PSEU|nr:hypothetical protein [Amycolatopsis bullii]GHF96468.1 hypothetical protein GCM10017567_08820 [Amycolatopsis bullii]